MLIESYQLTKLANERLGLMQRNFVMSAHNWTDQAGAHAWAEIQTWRLFVERAEKKEDVDTTDFRAWCSNQSSSHEKALFRSGSKPPALECARLAGLIAAYAQIDSFLSDEEEARRTEEE